MLCRCAVWNRWSEPIQVSTGRSCLTAVRGTSVRFQSTDTAWHSLGSGSFWYRYSRVGRAPIVLTITGAPQSSPSLRQATGEYARADLPEETAPVIPMCDGPWLGAELIRDAVRLRGPLNSTYTARRGEVAAFGPVAYGLL